MHNAVTRASLITLYMYAYVLEAYYLLSAPKVNISIISEEFGIDNVTVALQWTPAAVIRSLVSYNVSIIPQTAVIFNGSRSVIAQLVIPYNILYIVSISAIAPCDESTNAVTLNYSELLTLQLCAQ